MHNASHGGVITTVTLNPAIDQAMSIDEIAVGRINRCRLDALDPGGKGLNASRVIRRLGRTTLALGFLGGVTGAMIRTRLDAEDVPHDFDEVPEMTRINVMVWERSAGRRTRLYPPGAAVDPEKLGLLRERLARVPPGGIVILAGSVPPGLGQDVYRDLVGWLHPRGVRAFVDASGSALGAALEARPALIKPNLAEAAEVLGRELRTEEDVVSGALELRERGADTVVISRGPAGAIAVDGSGRWRVTGPRVAPRSAVGSGDSMVAGLAIELNEGRGLADGLRLGAAAGAATAIVPGTELCHPADVRRLFEEVAVRSI
ncbi:MAG TPA: 1-phosphofructokinase [Candidatus Limnocylindrales bacterium]|nr:1-phosphofructokinase [Candidatus Limnocylindrales bacterium]